MDKIPNQTRRWNMSRIRSADTRPELVLRSALHRMGFRFTLHCKDLPGKPDLVLPKYMTAIFVHGCFWHRHPNCKTAATPKSNADFWKTKFEANVTRDTANQSTLRKLGWRVIVVWECEIEKNVWKSVQKVTRLLSNGITSYSSTEYPNISSRNLWRIAEARSSYALEKKAPRPTKE